MRRFPLILFAVFVFLMTLSPAVAQQVDFGHVVDEIVTRGNATLDGYVPAEGLDTADVFSDLYFDVFEESGMEAALGMSKPALKTELESLFGQVIGAATRGKPAPVVDAAWAELRGRLLETAATQQKAKSGFLSALIQSFLILVREGFEAILVITALIAYLRRSNNEDKVRVIYLGSALALLASLATAYAMTVLFKVSGASREALEGATMLLAAVVLFFVSYWLISKRDAERWQKYVQGKIDTALSGGKVFTLGFAAFLAVYREGAETVLFYQALSAGAPGQGLALLTGFVAAAVALSALYWGMRTLSIKLPLGLFFSATAVFLYYLAINFAGAGILELQEARWVPITPLAGMPQISWLGFYPTLESVLAQCVLLVPLVAGGLWVLVRKQRPVTGGAQ